MQQSFWLCWMIFLLLQLFKVLFYHPTFRRLPDFFIRVHINLWIYAAKIQHFAAFLKKNLEQEFIFTVLFVFNLIFFLKIFSFTVFLYCTVNNDTLTTLQNGAAWCYKVLQGAARHYIIQNDIIIYGIASKCSLLPFFKVWKIF